MVKPIIAVDIDDVLADQAEAFLEYSNQTWGTNFAINDYTEHWMELWSVDLAEVEERANLYHSSGTMAKFRHKSDAIPVLTKLREKYRLVIVTSRRTQVKDETIEWINRHFDGIFEEVRFAGFFDDLMSSNRRWHLTKADIVKELGASYLIDDQLKHCLATADAGVKTLLFGDYKWNQLDVMPKLMTRCVNWQEVGRYFEAR